MKNEKGKNELKKKENFSNQRLKLFEPENHVSDLLF